MAGINFIELFLQASFLVQCILLLLFFSSVLAWAVIIRRSQVLHRAMHHITLFENKFWSGGNLTQLYREAATRVDSLMGIEQIFYSGFKEFLRLYQIRECALNAVVEGTNRIMQVAFTREFEKLETSLGFLAALGSVAPYIGLLGTVWGIMQAFTVLGAGAKQATLIMVAPVIAEALIATAMGLLTAIPAVIAYHRFGLQLNKIEQRYSNFIEEFIAILQRQLLTQRSTLQSTHADL